MIDIYQYTVKICKTYTLDIENQRIRSTINISQDFIRCHQATEVCQRSFLTFLGSDLRVVPARGLALEQLAICNRYR